MKNEMAIEVLRREVDRIKGNVSCTAANIATCEKELTNNREHLKREQKRLVQVQAAIKRLGG